MSTVRLNIEGLTFLNAGKGWYVKGGGKVSVDLARALDDRLSETQLISLASLSRQRKFLDRAIYYLDLLHTKFPDCAQVQCVMRAAVLRDKGSRSVRSQ